MSKTERNERETAAEEIRGLLAADGLIDDSAVVEPLSGGVSSDVVKVTCGDRAMVVKRALAKLRVEDDWFADLSRNRYEHRYMAVVGELLPEAIPRVLHTNDAQGFFCMEWLGQGWANWKEEMLTGRADRAIAAEAGRVLGVIHRRTFGDEALRTEFDNTKNFFDLRLESYLLTTGRRHPQWEAEFRAESDRIQATRECLVHGDYSPKNMMVRHRQIMILDCEVAWFGDPSFDLAFLLNHLHLKGLHHAPEDRGFAELPAAATEAYYRERGLPQADREPFDRRTGRLLLMLMLARIDGKSPAEYLSGFRAKQQFVRRFVTNRLADGSLTLANIGRDWFEEIRSVESA